MTHRTQGQPHHMEGPFSRPLAHMHNRKTESRGTLEGNLEVESTGRSGSMKDAESNASSGLSSTYSRDSAEWYKPYYLEEHDNSHDSGTASTTLGSTSPSSSPSPTMLTQATNNNMILSRGTVPAQTLPPAPGSLPPLPRGVRMPNPMTENSYAEIPYGALPSNNFDTPSGAVDQNKFHPTHARNQWKNNTNLVNLHLALDYPSERTSHVEGPLQTHQPHQQQQQQQQQQSRDLQMPDRRPITTSMIHLRDGPNGLLPVPQPRMAMLDVPSTDCKCDDEQCRKRKWRQTLMMVIVMALAGIAYLILGGMAGYYFGKPDCEKKCLHYPSLGGQLSNTTIAHPFTTSKPAVNASTNASSPEVGVRTTPIVSSATPAMSTTTEPMVTSESPPQYCSQVGDDCRCGPLGGSGGKPFTDRDAYRRLGNITGFAVKHNEYFISGLQMHYGAGSGAEHGYTEGEIRVNVKLLSGEHITAVGTDFTAGRGYLSRLVVHTDRRILGPYGGDSDHKYSLKGAKLLYIFGKSGPLIDQLGFVFDRCT